MAAVALRLCALIAAAAAQVPRAIDVRHHQQQQQRGASAEPAPSLWLADPEDAVVARGRAATLRCSARSTAPSGRPPRVAWLHQDEEIAPNDTRRVIRPDGSLYLPKVVPGKKGNGITGNYSCLVSNKAGTLKSGVAKIRVASMDREIVNVENVTVNELQPALLECYVHSVPKADIYWKYNSFALPQNSRYVPLSNGALLITETLSSDAGSYRCVARNSILNKTKSSKDIVLNVIPKLSEAFEPTFLPLNLTFNVTRLVGESVELLCPAVGWPTPQVQWKKNNVTDVGNSTILSIKSVKLRDAGNYTCTASNAAGKTSQTFRLEAQEKPVFNVTPTSKSVPSSRIVRLECQAKGTPDPKIYWLKDGKTLEIGGRIKMHKTGLVISHSFSTDSGLYQCVAINSAGRVWVAAQLEINVSDIRPPENIKCRPYDRSSICVSWQPPIKNVSAGIAYSVYSFYTGGDGATQLSGPEYVTNNTFQTVTGLHEGTNYTFYVRMYIKKASESSEKVTCHAGVRGNRNLDISPITKTSVELRWSEVSLDVPCSGSRDAFIVKWRKLSETKIRSAKSYNTNHVISGLEPGVDYEFRIVPESFSKEPDDEWVLFTLQDKEDDISKTEGGNVTEEIPLAPEHLEGVAINPSSVKLNWTNVSATTKFYMVCFVSVAEKKECEEGKLVKTFANKVNVSKLKPSTTYEFRVRSHHSDEDFGPFSQSIEVETPSEVPSQITGFKYKVLNSTTVCLKWLPPVHKYGTLKEYIISYAPDRNLPLEKWPRVSIPADRLQKDFCWGDSADSVSTYIGGLDAKKSYMFLIHAANEVGLGKPEMLMEVSTNVYVASNDKNGANAREQMVYHQKVGVIIGVILALVCIFVCVSCILLRRRCLKRRAISRTRLAAGGNPYPAVAHYASHAGAVQVRLEDPCRADEHEIEHLVSEERPPQVSFGPTHLDTKGNVDFPNGHVNGMAKFLGNGNAGGVHITENPRYYGIGNGDAKPVRFEEDPNCNVRPSKFHDLHRLFESSKLADPNRNGSGDLSLDTTGDAVSLNTTAVTRLDDTLLDDRDAHRRRVSPVIGPNG